MTGKQPAAGHPGPGRTEQAGTGPAYASARHGGPAHVLLVSYLFSPVDLPPARRAKSLRDTFAELGVRTSVLTSTVSGKPPLGEDAFVVRAPDLRAGIAGQHLTLGRPGMRAVSPPGRRLLTRLLVPDTTTLSWMPAALTRVATLLRSDRPDAVVSISPPESTHLVGLAFHAAG